MTTADDRRREARISAVRVRDADRLQASLGDLPGPVERPSLVVLSGLPGSGKSYFARALARRYPATVLDSDALRAVLFEHPKHTQPEHARLFPAIHLLTERLLGSGAPVVVDATNLKEANRRAYYDIAARTGARIVLVRVWAPAAVTRQRLRSRSVSADPDDRSTADLAVYEAMRGEAEPVRRRHVTVNTASDITQALDKVLALLQS